MFEEIIKRNNVSSVVLPRCNKLLFNQIRLPWSIHKIKADWYLFMAFPVPLLLFKKNMVSTIHDICCWDCPETMNGLSEWYFRLSHKVAIKKCQAIITISEFSKKRIMEKLGYSADKIWLIYCGIDEKFKPVSDNKRLDNVKGKYSLPDDYILSLSTLEPRKNVRLLIDAYRELVLSENFEVPLVLAGRKGWKMEELMSGIEPAVKEKIVFTGFIDDEDLAAVYSCANLFVFPSKYEGFGIPPLEAMACGVPVVSSDAASLPEVLGDAAIYFESGDKGELKQRIIQAHKSNEFELRILKEKGLNRAHKYKWNAEALKFPEYLHKELSEE